MAHIFDENSEFKRYLRNEGKRIPETPKQAPDFANLAHNNQEPEPIRLHLDAETSTQRTVIQPKASVDPFELDLSGAKLKNATVPPAVEPAKVMPRPVADKPQVMQMSKAPEVSGLKSFFIEHLRTLMYFVIFFVGGYLLLNLPAYYEVGKNFYYDLTGQERSAVLRTFTASDSNTTTVASADEVATASSLPPFSLEVTPPGTRIIIPSLDKNVPVVSVPEDNLVKRDWQGLERDLQSALKDGVVHYPGTPWPGQSGNVVLTGHSSYYPWDPGRFKDVFAILHNVKLNDEIVIFHNQRKYRYRVSETKVILPEQVEVLGDTGDDRITLITCTPIGTNLKRLIVTAKPISEQ
ncbi:sortase [Candidatus Gracilibacteria bacterium]|nr:sortase [Candidatus Gracilibacteria bacterium]